jgi:succinate dehydrogenase subunit C
MPSAVPQPKYYHRKMPVNWWLGRWNYTWFILRELSSAFVAYWVIITLVQIAALTRGPQNYAAFEACMARPGMVILNLIAFIFILFHTLSWFRLVPQAMLPRIGGQRTSIVTTSAPMYVIWAVASVVVACFVLGVF